jgi:hypothetical protein
MKKYRFKIFLFVLVAATVYAACRKTDSQLEKPVSVSPESRFFESNRSSDPLEKALVNFVKGQNDEKGFVEKVIKKIGYPRWNKAITIQKASQPGLETIDTTITYIPFVRDSQNYVNASLLISTVPGDTTMGYVCDWQYATKENATDSATVNSAEGIALFMMMMDVNVFNHRDFMLTDSLLFKGLSQNGNLPTSGNNVSRKIHLDVNFNNNGGNLSESMTISLVPIINWTMWYNYIIDTYGSVAFYLNSPESNGGSGGGSGPGSGLPPGCNEGPVTPGTVFTDIDFICGPGWVPVPIGFDDPPDEPIDSMLKKYSRAINSTSDSLFTISMANNEEHGFIIVKNLIDSVYPKNCTTAHNPGYVKQYRSVANGEKIVAELHIHPDTSSNPLERDAPSGDDLSGMRNNTRDRYTVFVDCGDQRFALVIENVDTARIFFNSHSLNQIVAAHDSISTTILTPSWVSNWRNATMQSIIQILGPSSTSGIGFYVSSNTEKTIYTKLNP